ncbi:MAG: histidine--tRNA ligase [Gammaproteobacteria bacterium]|jgi:histidyl-tRNA synthetase|nr:histidine--tRNA ligase [Gammaproteobacteria bacterium]MBT5204830.1 histidine--tRNA ligase [Gammaproteobacteria bacterium]MBT5604023.1 histidine--tRNA ligase [Gammaproteobacteria bacterium]MBT6246782.1 histidine--tRNA ligase [Gammaproteobacteria bacterium]
MAIKVKAVRGMQDLLPEKKAAFRFVEDQVRNIVGQYGYREVGLPVIESTQLFSRLVGESTDIVEKEMYSFADRNGESLTLRPEGTAGLVRLANENGLIFNQVQRFWYAGPMFRYERPQKGRYRQFEQIGVECLGMEGPDIDAEILLMSARIWEALGIEKDVTLELNSLGDVSSRQRYKDALVNYLNDYKSDLDEDSLRRLSSNPMRILDSKVPATQQLLSGAPELLDFLDEDSQRHFQGLCEILEQAGLQYCVNPRIVRGLDYYNRTVFEWVTDTLGSQGTVCGGGRYDGLVEQLGGKSSASVGFAMGLDRLVLMVEGSRAKTDSVELYVVSIGDQERIKALVLAERIRKELGITTLVHSGSSKLKAQMKKADASGAKAALIIGEQELTSGEITVRLLRSEGSQERIKEVQLVAYLRKVFDRE